MRLPVAESVSDCPLVDFDIIQCTKQGNGRNRRLDKTPWTDGLVRYSFETLPETIGSTHSAWSLPRAEAIQRLLKNFRVFSMLTFRQVPSGTANLRFYVPRSTTKCAATVGESSAAMVYLGASEHCWSDATILHELGHVAGMHHTQHREDRDEYLHMTGEAGETRYPGSFVFDFRSIMMYPLTALQATLTTKGRTRLELQHITEKEVGRLDSLSRLDMQTLEAAYGDGDSSIKAAEGSDSYLPLLWVFVGLAVLLVGVAVLRSKKCQKAPKVDVNF